MKRFSFRLQKLLDLRRVREEQAQRRMAEAQRARALQLEALRAAEIAASLAQEQFRQVLSKKIGAGEALINHRYGARLRSTAVAEADRLRHSEEVASNRRRELAEAARQKQTLETLKEKRLEEHTALALHIEQGQLDDDAGRRFAAGKTAWDNDGG